MEHRPILLTITGPSGVGKDTVTDIVAKRSDFSRLGTYTTRAMREGEIEGDHHFYVTEAEFQALDAKEHFEDHIMVGNIHYAIATDKVRESLQAGKNIILVIQVDGVRIIKKHWPNAISVYLMPPSAEAHQDRFEMRGDSTEEIQVRMRDDGILKDTSEFNFVIVNETGQAEKTADAILAFVSKQV